MSDCVGRVSMKVPGWREQISVRVLRSGDELLVRELWEEGRRRGSRHRSLRVQTHGSVSYQGRGRAAAALDFVGLCHTRFQDLMPRIGHRFLRRSSQLNHAGREEGRQKNHRQHRVTSVLVVLASRSGKQPVLVLGGSVKQKVSGWSIGN